MNPLEQENRRLRAEVARLEEILSSGASTMAGELFDAERQLGQTNRDLHSILSHMPSMISYWDLNLRNRFGNHAYADWFGADPERLPGKHVRDVIGEEIYRLNLPYIEAALRGEKQQFERNIRSPDGSQLRHCLVQYIPDIVGDRVHGLYAMVTDISAIRQVELTLRQSEERYRTLIEWTPEPLAVHDGARFLYVNPAAVRLFGAGSAQELLGQAILDRVHPDFRETELTRAKALMQQGADLSLVEQKLLKIDGTIITVEVQGAQIVFDGAQAIQIAMHDITERKRLEQEAQEQSRFLEAVIDNVNANIYVKDHEGRYLYVNQSVAAVFGRPIVDIIGRTDLELLPPETARQIAELDSRVHLSGLKHAAEEMLTDSKGTPCYYWSVKIPITMRDHPNALIGFSTDLTELKAAQQAQRIAATAFESQQGMFITDARKVILQVNKVFTEITGYSPEEAVGRTPELLSSGRHDAAFYADMWKCVNRSGAWQGELWNRRKNGTVYPETLSISAVRNDAGLLTHYVGAFSDITSYKAAEEQIQDLAFTDLLTGLPNRLHLIVRLQQAMAAEKQNHQGALLMVDLDNFKNLNDALGHAQGDEVLQRFAKRLSSAVREGDTVARMGGDEFAVLLDRLSLEPQKALGQVEAVASKIVEAIDKPYQLASSTISCSASIGVTFFGEQQEQAGEPMKRAELAMYEAKSAGRNTLRFFDPQMQAVVSARVKLEAALQEAIESNRFILHYQAQVSESEDIVGVEALLRWTDPTRGMVSPAEFIPLAEETGLILPIGAWVLETACRQLALWAGTPSMARLSIAVNVSARQFRESDFVGQVLATLERTGANPRLLKLELTESVLIADAEDVIVKMDALKAIGIGFAIDDFGTGYSSLSYLKRLPLERLKIDQSFVRNILMDADDAAIARAVIAMATSMGLGVIAEGVETQAQRALLASMGCHTYQGYLFSRPLPIQDFEAFVRRMIAPTPI
ncbi:MAG: sensor domain-containing protein [Rhodoferax sp.]